MRLLVLVNGPPDSADGERAEAIARRLPASWEIRLVFRGASKSLAVFEFAIVARKFKPDLIYVMKMAYSGVIAGYLSRVMCRCRLICDTGDMAFELARSCGRYGIFNLLMIRAVEQLGLRGSDAIVVRGSYHAILLRAAGFRRVAFIPDGVEPAMTYESDGEAVRIELGFGSDFVLGVVGAMEWSERHQMCYGWDVVEAMAFLRDAPVQALIVGDGKGKIILQDRAKELGVAERVRFVGRKSKADVGYYLSAMDACVSTQSADIVGRVRTTGKLPLYLSHGKYVIATNVGEARHVLRKIGCLLPYSGVRDDHYPARLAEHVKQLLSHGRPKPYEAARQVATEHFDYDILALRMERLCEALVNN